MGYFRHVTHAYHKNICKGTTKWSDNTQCRDFNDEIDMTNQMINNINSCVKENDILFHLGDWSFGGIDKIWEFRKRINCKNIHLILGNHDEHIRDNKRLPNVSIGGNGELIDFDDSMFTPHAQYIFSSVQDYKEIFVDGIQIIMSHYSFRVWNNSHRGSIMLYAHSHGTLDEFKPNNSNPNWIGDDYYTKSYRTMDVGMDTNNLFPYKLSDIISNMLKRKITLLVDNHNENTDSLYRNR
jgi:calcineurin-like phosphoesterase family protein